MRFGFPDEFLGDETGGDRSGGEQHHAERYRGLVRFGNFWLQRHADQVQPGADQER